MVIKWFVAAGVLSGMLCVVLTATDSATLRRAVSFYLLGVVLPGLSVLIAASRSYSVFRQPTD